ncbi:MAG TPA: thiamine pyrophosphate-binding protein [Burkholderiaceae bacterium]|nr:thiamine pyrophosphate-binding protein [Burkholderiaceae bacterium]
MARVFRGADALTRTLRSAGVARVFTLSGNHVMPVFDATIDAGVSLVHTRHEAAAVHMADAWARLTGEPGIALVTGGPGHANAVSALYTAQMAEAPVVLLSGHAPNSQLGMGAFQEVRQAEMAAPVTKASWTCASVDEVVADLARAIGLARSGRPGPVHLSLPTDVLERPADPGRVPGPQAFGAQVQALPAADAKAILARLWQAKRPLVLAGPACMTKRGRECLRALEAVIAVPVIGMESPRGIGDPSLGAFAQVLEKADCVLLVGKRCDFTLKFGQPPALDAGCSLVQVDPEPPEIERTRRAVGARLAAAFVADAMASIDALAACARERGIESGAADALAAWLAEARAAIAWRPPEWDRAAASERDRLHPVQACRPLQKLLDAHPDSVFVSDGGEIGQWAQACLSAPNRVINGVAGSIGAGLPFALAARAAKPDVPVVAVMGDGTFGFHVAEIDTAVRYGLPFVAVVGNDARWNAEYQIQLKDYGAERLVGCELRPMRYDKVSEAFGGYGEQVTEPAQLGPAAARAQASGLPACLNVMIEGVAAPVVRRPG